jgi:hypothetical protein
VEELYQEVIMRRAGINLGTIAGGKNGAFFYPAFPEPIERFLKSLPLEREPFACFQRRGAMAQPHDNHLVHSKPPQAWCLSLVFPQKSHHFKGFSPFS